jgi:hypothetical protein
MSDVSATSADESGFLTLRRTCWVLAALVAVALAWRCYGIADRSLWYDEANTYFTSRLPWPKLLDRLRYDSHPPLYYVFLNTWTSVFGTSLVALRAPSVLFGAAAILGVYLFTVEALRGRAGIDGVQQSPLPKVRETGLWAAALVAVSAFQIHAAWEVRPYGMDVALAAFSSWILLRALHARSGRLVLWVLYALLVLLFSYTHYFALFTVVAQALFVLGYLTVQARQDRQSRGLFGRLLRRPQLLPALLTAGLIILGWLPGLQVFLEQRRHVQAGYFVPPVSWFAARTYAYHMFITPESGMPAGPGFIDLCCLIACIAIPAALLLCKAKSAEWFVGLGAALPFVLSLLASEYFGTRIFYSRYFVFAHLFLLVGTALLLGRIRLSGARMLGGATLVLLLLILDVYYVRLIDLPNCPSYRGAVQYVEERRAPGEPVIVVGYLYYLPLLYHAGGSHDWYMLGNNRNPDNDAWMAMGADHVIRRKNLPAITSRRVWVVNTIADGGTARQVPEQEQWVPRSRIEFADHYTTGYRVLEVVEYEVFSREPQGSADR